MGGSKEEGAALSSVVSSERRNSGNTSKYNKFHLKARKNLLRELLNTGTGYLGGCGVLVLGGIKKLTGYIPEQPALADPALSREVASNFSC